MPDPIADALVELVERELSEPEGLPAARQLCEAIQARHGDAIAAVLFYGSCLRKGTAEGVLDFYVLVDSYRDTYGRGALALGNALLPPNVFYLAIDDDGPGLRCKYAVISLADFQASVSPACLHSYIWARFAQPARLLYVRDAQTRAAVVRSVAEAIVTCTRRLMVFLPAHGRVQRFSIAAFWQEALTRTYGAELRPESADTARALHDADVERYERAGIGAFETLRMRAFIDELNERGPAVEIEMPHGRLVANRLRWQLTRPLAKTLAVLRLFKTATTFGDWLPYALWKLERHSGVKVELSERQRRHPLIFGWPAIFRLLTQRALR